MHLPSGIEIMVLLLILVVWFGAAKRMKGVGAEGEFKKVNCDDKDMWV